VPDTIITTDSQGRATTFFYPVVSPYTRNYGVITISAYPVTNPNLVKTTTYTCPPAPVIN
jgi:hypothetical protein